MDLEDLKDEMREKIDEQISEGLEEAAEEDDDFDDRGEVAEFIEEHPEWAEGWCDRVTFRGDKTSMCEVLGRAMEISEGSDLDAFEIVALAAQEPEQESSIEGEDNDQEQQTIA